MSPWRGGLSSQGRGSRRLSPSSASMAGGREAQVQVPGVCARAFGADELAGLQALQQAAQVAGVKIELARQLRRCRRVAMREFPEESRFGEAEARVGQAFVQDADASRVETIEAADDRGSRLDLDSHGS
jgi:hypothetical protein